MEGVRRERREQTSKVREKVHVTLKQPVEKHNLGEVASFALKLVIYWPSVNMQTARGLCASVWAIKPDIDN